MGFLKEDGVLILEIGQNQEREIIKIFTDSGLKFVQDKRDLSGIIRCLMFRKN
jgi:methylase of polypeptide subunit release factors